MTNPQDGRVSRPPRWGPFGEGSSPGEVEDLVESKTIRFENVVKRTLITVTTNRPYRDISEVPSAEPHLTYPREAPPPRSPTSRWPVTVGTITGLLVGGVVFASNFMQIPAEHVPAAMVRLSIAPIYVEFLGATVSGLLSGWVTAWISVRARERR